MQRSTCQHCKRVLYFGLFRTFGEVDLDYDPEHDENRWRHAFNGLVTCYPGSVEWKATPGTIEESSQEEVAEILRHTGGVTMRFEKLRGSNGQFYFRLVASNNEIIAASEGYHNRSDRDNAIALIKLGADQASIVDKDFDEPVTIYEDNEQAIFRGPEDEGEQG